MQDNMANKLKRQLYAKKFTGYVILAAIGLVFVFFGYSGRMKGMGIQGVSSVARVNNTFISVADFQSEENRIQQYYASLFGGQIDLSSQRNMLRQQAVENLLHAEIVSQAAQKEGIYSTDAEVRDFIVKDIPAFQDNGQFQRERYSAYLDGTRTTAGNFESRVRKDIANLRTRHLVELASAPLKLETQKMKELRDNKINVEFARLDADELSKNMTVSAADANAKLADADFLKKAQDYFNLYKSEWERPETVTAQHILISAKAGDSSAEAAALKKAQDLRARADKEDFGKLAGAYSEDPGSKAKQGKLDAFSRGKMVKEFEDAAFALKPGQISQPVKSPFGYHLIKVTAHDPGHQVTFDEVKEKVAQRVLAREKAEDALKGLDAAVAAGDKTKVESILASVNAKWDSTGDFDLAADAVPRLPPGAVADAAFEVSAQKPMLDRVIHEGPSRYVLRYKGSKVDPAAASGADSADVFRRRHADAVYNNWVNGYRAGSSIEVNNEIFHE